MRIPQPFGGVGLSAGAAARGSQAGRGADVRGPCGLHHATANGLGADGFFSAETARDYVEEAAYTAIAHKRP